MKRFCYALWVFAALFASAIWSGDDCSDGEIEKLLQKLAQAKKDGDQAYAHRIISKLWAIDNPHESRRVIAEEGSRPETEHLF